MMCQECTIVRYCETEPKTWQFESEEQALKVISVMDECLQAQARWNRLLQLIQQGDLE